VKFILIALLAWPNTQIVGTADYPDLERCERGVRIIQREHPKATVFCVEVPMQ
jgi:hypothetical protein